MANDSNIVVRLRLLGRAAFGNEARAGARDLGHLERAGRSANVALGLLARGGAIAATGIGLATVAIARMGSETNATQDAQRVSFTALLKSKSKAAEMMKQIQQLALDSPILDPASTGDAVRMLLAYGISTKKVIPLVKALGDMSAASGKSIVEVMPRAALALGQIEGKGKLQAQEMNQLAESVGLSRKSIRKELGLTAKEFEDTFKPGKNIKSNVAVPAIMRAMTKQAAGAADMLAKTTAGRIARGKEVMKLAAGDFTRPFYDAVGKLAGKAGDALSGLQSSGKVKGFSQGLFSGETAKRSKKTGDFTTKGKAQNLGAKVNQKALEILKKVGKGAMEVGRQIIDAFKPAEPFFKNVLLPLFGGIAKGILGGVVGAFKIAMPIIKAVMTAFGWLGNKLKPLKPFFSALGQVIGFVFGGPLLTAIKGVRIFGVVARILLVPLRVLGGIVRLIGRGLGILGRAVSAAAGPFRGVFAGAVRAAGGLLRGVGTAITSTVNGLKSVLSYLGLVEDKKPKALETPLGDALTAPGSVLSEEAGPPVSQKGKTRASGGGKKTPTATRNQLVAVVPPAQRNDLHVYIDGKPVHGAVVREERRRVEAGG